MARTPYLRAAWFPALTLILTLTLTLTLTLILTLTLFPLTLTPLTLTLAPALTAHLIRLPCPMGTPMRRRSMR